MLLHDLVCFKRKGLPLGDVGTSSGKETGSAASWNILSGQQEQLKATESLAVGRKSFSGWQEWFGNPGDLIFQGKKEGRKETKMLFKFHLYFWVSYSNSVVWKCHPRLLETVASPK